MSAQAISWRDYLRHGLLFNLYGPVKYVPSPIGDVLRRLILSFFMKSMGKVRVYEGVTIWYPDRIQVGDDTTLNEFVYVSGYGGVKIGSGVRIGHRTSIISSDHDISDPSVRVKDSGLTSAPVDIGDDVFIGCNVTILMGVRIGKGAVIAAGSVVTRDVPEFTIAGGVPAKVLKDRRPAPTRV